MEGGAWWATVHGVAKSRTRLSEFTSLHTYPDGFMGFSQDSNPKERIGLLASDRSTLLSPLFQYFILSSVLRHTLFHVLTLLLYIFIDICKKFSEIKTQE